MELQCCCCLTVMSKAASKQCSYEFASSLSFYLVLEIRIK